LGRGATIARLRVSLTVGWFSSSDTQSASRLMVSKATSSLEATAGQGLAQNEISCTAVACHSYSLHYTLAACHAPETDRWFAD